MPSLANGHLGLTVFGNAIYMNGVYNGRGGQSRRARLPNWLNISAELYSENQEIPSLPTDTAYQMLLRDGCFQWQKYFHDGLQTINMTQRIYAHRYFDRAVIYELFIIRNHTEGTHLYYALVSTSCIMLHILIYRYTGSAIVAKGWWKY